MLQQFMFRSFCGCAVKNQLIGLFLCLSRQRIALDAKVAEACNYFRIFMRRTQLSVFRLWSQKEEKPELCSCKRVDRLFSFAQ
ncbi:unnamed protein product [Soboliphyme baturini]|uniref:Secreted protein n=1 Tax=Soboliphyme baturini TaxID=241478 RepID=A0A183IPS7_9BILA|nr:unnamed protein product [Soboliphyme baturini]